MMKPFNHLLGVLMMTGILAAGVSAVSAAGGTAPDGAVVALSTDPAGGRLLRVQPDRLFESRDSGRSWQAIPLPAAVEDARLAAAAVPAAARDTLYIAGPGLGVQRSDDAGKTWRSVGDGLPSREVVAFAVHRDQPETLYTVIPDDGIYRSEDAGTTWRKMDSGPTQGIRQLVHSDMPGSMQTGWLVAASGEAVRLSMDCFCGWRLGGAFEAGTVHSVAYDPASAERIYAAADGGVFRSTNGGRDWERVSAGGPVKVALAVGSAGTVYAATRDGVLLRSDDHGQTWAPLDA